MSDSNDTVGFVAPDPADLAPLFPGYEIQSLIATGGMGAVYCAVQKSLDRTVALKILPMEFSKDAAFCAGFEAEAKAMARLNHPNLIGVYDFGEVNGMLYIIMEYVPGKSVYHSAYGKILDPQEVIRLVTGVCNGLAHAHDNGILHRDIKPSNILLDLNAEPKIGDFGLARPLGSTVEEGEEIFGTPHYTAPEVVDNPHSVDYRADIFSVGVLLHELLTSRLPADDPRPASAIVRCDPRFDAIIRKATQPLPAARYTSAREIAKDLQVIASATVPKVQRGPAAPVHRATPPVRGRGRGHSHVQPRKKSGGGGVIVFLIAAAVAGIAVFIFQSNQPEEKPSEPSVTILPTQSPESGNEEPISPSPSEETQIAPTPPTNTDVDDSPSMPVAPDPEAVSPDNTEEEVQADAGVAAPKADVAAFFARARAIMQEKARGPISAYNLGMKENFSGFRRSFDFQVAKFKDSVAPKEDIIETAFTGWREAGDRIPDELDAPLSDFPELEQVRAEYELKEHGVIDTYNQEISKLSALYIVGLRKQLERYQADADAGAVNLVEKKIAATRAEPDYFSTVVLGIPADAE